MSKDSKEIDPAVVAEVSLGLRQAVIAASSDGKVACATLLELAHAEAIPPKVVGAAATLEGVKIHSCELGCF